ncbi:hypothetical protein GGX14DRAFT_560066 [Mycena pura]|uniref:Uncharacterized protein n=1 Tax=Mycena pura TaxID=153505 RepID=A0AAD6YGG5_9AGAR|nr:hypothetical protein GGX14DRAFT_560066 [Mycena pura]
MPQLSETLIQGGRHDRVIPSTSPSITCHHADIARSPRSSSSAACPTVPPPRRLPRLPPSRLPLSHRLHPPPAACPATRCLRPATPSPVTTPTSRDHRARRHRLPVPPSRRPAAPLPAPPPAVPPPAPPPAVPPPAPPPAVPPPAPPPAVPPPAPASRCPAACARRSLPAPPPAACPAARCLPPAARHPTAPPLLPPPRSTSVLSCLICIM